MTYHAAKALTEAALRESWNRGWRFSPAKKGLWLLLLQVALAAGVIWRLGEQRGITSFESAALAMMVQAGVWSFVAVFLAGRTQLFGAKSAVRLVHISPAPASSVLLSQVAVSLPGRAWSMLIWAGLLGQLLPASVWWWAVPLLWLTGVVVGSLGQLAGLTMLVAWVRAFPQALAASWAVTMALQLGLVYYAIYLVVSGQPLQALEELRWWVVGGLATLLGLPGAVMLVWLGQAPGRAGEAYREGWLNLADLGDGSSRPRRSLWLDWLPGGAGAVLAKEWVQAGRNPFTWARLAITLGLVAALAPIAGRLAGPHAERAALGAGLGLIFFAFCEMASALFSNEQGRSALWVLTGASPASILAGKLTAASPLALLSGAAVWAAALAIGVEGAGALALRGALAGLGMAAVMVGLGALDVGLPEVQDESAELEVFTAAMEQVPRGAFSVAGMVGAGGLGAAAVFWPHPLLSLLPLGALIAGFVRLRFLN